uniref:NAD(+) kinase n=1 Tax=Physcomitrium patens TaxID=3218 RepID=A0A7I4A3Y7_PHYPA
MEVAQILIGLTSSPNRLEHGKIENLAIRSQRLDSDGVGAMITNRDEKNHLSEFSDALQTVAKALEDVAVKKALAQDEAAQWKHKYELELLRNSQLERSIASRALDSSRQDNLSVTSVISEGDIDATEFRSSPQNTQTRSNGYLQYKETIQNSKVLSYSPDLFNNLYLDTQLDSKISEKASFTLTLDPVDERRKEQNHDLVSFDDGDINAEVRSNKQIALVWNSSPASVFILLKPNAAAVQQLCEEMVWWLREQNVTKIYVEPRVKAELMEENADFEFIQTCETEKQLVTINKSVDLVITLGGDGTMLWAASLFKGPMPPLVAFSMGSLGFMTKFQSSMYRESLQAIMKGPAYITLRHRLHCQIIRHDRETDDNTSSESAEYLVLNEVSIDRGMSSALSNLECFCDGHFVTIVQGDGLIISSPSGSTAYSLAAGGSVVHPQVPGILFTPICPHSLSFRPLILPDYVTLRVQLPLNCRGQAWASFDGKGRQQLWGGDALIVRMSEWPVPAVCEKESSGDFLRSVRESLHWNRRNIQLADERPSPSH